MKKNVELILKTIISLALIGVGWWGISTGFTLVGVISIIAGVIIGYLIYGERFNWMDWWP